MNAFQIYEAVVIFIVGTVIGSFSNVLIYRLPIGMDFKKGSSICPHCNHPLKWYDLFPLFSYIFLCGKCRYCKAKISPQYPIVEALNGIMYVLAFIFLTDRELKPELIGYFMILTCLIVLSWTDFQHNIIPDSMWICILLGGIEIYVCDVIRNGFNPDLLIEKLIGLVLVSGVFIILGLIFQKLKGVDAIGGGDIKLMAAAGFVLGWRSVILATLIGTTVGLVFTIVYFFIAYKKEKKAHPEKFAKEKEEKKERKAREAAEDNKIARKVKAQREKEKAEELLEQLDDEDIDLDEDDEEDEEDDGKVVPFGPHLAFGIAIALFLGAKILTWYADWVVGQL